MKPLPTTVAAFFLVCAATIPQKALAFDPPAPKRMPNIIFLLADDLGYGEVSCFGQQKFQTPNIDRIAAEGMKLTQHYAGSSVCAPSRCSLLSARHNGHAYIRENSRGQFLTVKGPVGKEGQEPVPAGELTFPLTLKKLGYTSGCYGKWGLGGIGESGDPLKQGFDHFYGYICQAVAHNYYPTHLWDDDTRVDLDNPYFAAHQALPKDADPNNPESYKPFLVGKQYAPDLISDRALKFMDENKDHPFFLYYSTTAPHLALQVPDDEHSKLREFIQKFAPEAPYAGDRDYLPCQYPRATYAAMITRMDWEIGRILEKIKALGLSNDTIIVFTSDNGPLYDRLGGTDTEFFNGAAGLRGRKGNFYEGGFREPCVIEWPGAIKPGTVSDRVTGFEDWLPTFLELAGHKSDTPAGIDGISFAPTLRGAEQAARPFLYRESPGYGGEQCVRAGDWKLLHKNVNPKKVGGEPVVTELYDLATDTKEEHNVAAAHPDIVQKLGALMESQHTPSSLFPLTALGEKRATAAKE